MALWSWGSDIYGRLGHGTEDQHRGTPTEVRALSGSRLISVTVGSAHNVAIEEDGKCYTWGKCHYGQLGHGEMDQNELIPRPVSALSSVKIASVGAGDSHVLAVTDAGELYTWGVGFYGCLGHGDEASLTTPKRVEKLQGDVMVNATGGAFHSLCVNDRGQVFVWGRNHCGQLGIKALEVPDYSKGGKTTKLVRLNQKLPMQLAMKPDYVAKMVSARNDHSLVLLENGYVLSFGSNEKGQLGRDQKTPELEDVNDFMIDPNHFKNIVIDGSHEKVVYISAGYDHCAAITESHLLYTWGGGKHGQHGQGHTRDLSSPSLMEPFSDGKEIKVSRVSCGDSFTIALCMDGTLLAFGSSDYGKLGTGSNGNVTKPTPILTKLPKIINGICCGTNHTLAYTLIQK